MIDKISYEDMRYKDKLIVVLKFSFLKSRVKAQLRLSLDEILESAAMLIVSPFVFSWHMLKLLFFPIEIFVVSLFLTTRANENFIRAAKAQISHNKEVKK